jgi:2,3-bisphosphoglycerate-independent phosphoglycerate mutase
MVVNDHPTSVWTGRHEAGYFPYLIYTHGMQPNQINKFDEQTAVAGPVRRIQDVMEEAISRLK